MKLIQKYEGSKNGKWQMDTYKKVDKRINNRICPSAILLRSHLSAILLQSGSGFSTLVIVETLIFFRCNSVERVHLFSPGVKLICLLRYLFLVSCRGKGMGWGVMWTWKSNLSCFHLWLMKINYYNSYRILNYFSNTPKR